MAKFILGGSTEVLPNKYIRCAVFEGEHKWDIKGNQTLKYVTFSYNVPDKNKTVLDLAIEAYNDTTRT